MSEEITQADTLATPEEHAAATGNVLELKSRRTIGGASLGSTYKPAHAAAAQLHGWEAHKAATVEPFKLTREAYVAALAAAMSGEDPHEDALSPYAPQRLPAPDTKQIPARRKVRR